MNLNAPASTLGLAAFAFLTLLVSTIVPWWLARKAKQQDWAREDAVADRLIAANERVAKSSEQLATASGEMNGKLDALQEDVGVVRTWTNHKMTEEMQRHLEEMQFRLVGLEEIVSLKKAARHKPSPEALGVIKATKERIDKLQMEIQHRQEQQKVIDEHVSSDAPQSTHTAATITTIKVPMPNG